MELGDLWDSTHPEHGDGDVERDPACELDEFWAQSASGLLGSFDGRDARDLHVYAVAPGDEQLLVSIHEQLHHELQWSTGWGLIGAMAGLLSESGHRRDQLQTVAQYCNKRARHVHEVFATTVSAGVLGVQRARELLVDNHRYLRYLDQGLSLGGDPSFWPWQFRESAIQMLLRSLMQPQELLAIAQLGFDRLSAEHLQALKPPDARLLRTRTSGTWWDSTFQSILELDPDRGGETGGPWGRILPSDASGMERLKEYEETILIPRLADTARGRMEAVGVHCLDEEEYLRTAGLLRDSFASLAPSEWQIELLTNRRPMSQEPLGAERERIQLHDRRAVGKFVSADEMDDATFVLRVADEAPIVLLTCLTGRSYSRQFGLDDLLNVPSAIALAGWPTLDATGVRHVPLAFLDPSLTAGQIVETFTNLPVCVLTTLSLTRDSSLREQVLEVPRAFVLLDLPLNLQIGYWVEDGWTVRFSVMDLNSEYGLTLLVFALDELPSLLFLSYRSTAGFGELAQLLDRHPNKLTPGFVPDASTLHGLTAVTSWLFSSWWRFQEAEELD